MTAPKSGVYEIGLCQCGFVHDVSEIMSCRAGDRLRDDKTMTVENVPHELFAEFHEIAIRDHVSDKYLRRMCLGHSEQTARLRDRVEQCKKDGKFKDEELGVGGTGTEGG